ncbi:nuclear transport factor 2 family protein [Streptomyces fulvoviolaceus]|uniref:nuclear transport factor 2 family protein n=1 Tax=Streptomyces fulvoviolaceus TaxID=285535 RepID=UPI000693F0F6|nr:nuclear transport factor 2 family protein [Streptomyces fulvoviolaceus]
MNQGTEPTGTSTRRQLLRAAAVGGTAAAAASLLPASTAWADTRARGGSQYVAGVDVLPDASHATSALVAHIRGYYQAKSDRNLAWQSSYFSHRQTTYIDAILGWHWYTWQDLHDGLATFYPKWPKDSKSYPTRILGDTTSAILFFTDTPGMFGPGQVRNAGAVNFDRQGKIERWVDYWDSRQFGVSSWRKEQEPPNQWPTDFRESTVGETASPLMRRVVAGLADALRRNDIDAAMDLFSSDAVFEDVPAHIQITSKASIHAYLTKAGPALPYVGAGTGIRHVLGNDVGGGYEWTAVNGPVPRGITGIELDPWGRIERLTAVWNGAYADDALLTLLARKAIEY